MNWARLDSALSLAWPTCSDIMTSAADGCGL